MTARLAEPPQENPEDDPEKLQDIRQDKAATDLVPRPEEPALEGEKVAHDLQSNRLRSKRMVKRLALLVRPCC